MSRRCQVTGKAPMSGSKISHAHNVSKRRFYPNLQKKRFWVPEEKRWVTLKVSARGIKEITLKGIGRVLREMRDRGERV
jgi:large subunit ribosomal protein L28